MPSHHNIDFSKHRYDALTGDITVDGKPVGSSNGKGYLRISFAGRRVLAHVLAWRLHYGEWPSLTVDHKNRNRSDNRISNLRLATATENGANKLSSGTSGERGVYFDSHANRWAVGVSVSKSRLKWYAATRLSAVLAARVIRRAVHGEFAA